MTTPTNSDRLPNFEGHESRECGEHRTVGSYRAWCHDCSQWCYPEMPCNGCQIPKLEAEINKLNAEKAETIEVLSWCPTTITVDQWWKEQAKPHLDKLKPSPD